MNSRANMARRPKIDYTEENIKLAAQIYNKVKDTLDFLLFIKEDRQTKLTVILIETDYKLLNKTLEKEKRKTDIIYKIDDTNDIYLLICQETDSNGAYKLLQRVFSKFKKDPTVCTCASLVEVIEESNSQKIIFKLLDNFIGLMLQPKQWKKCQIALKKI